MKKLASSLVALVVIIFACSKSTSSFTTDCSDPKSFATDVNPIIQSSCATNAGCHASGSTNGPGPLTDYGQVYSARSAIRSAVISKTMPQNGSLTPTQINNIVCWIDSGASNN
jgi:hypothetical protein